MNNVIWLLSQALAAGVHIRAVFLSKDPETQQLKGSTVSEGRKASLQFSRDAQWVPGAKQPSVFRGSCYLQTKLIKSPTLTPSNLFYDGG